MGIEWIKVQGQERERAFGKFQHRGKRPGTMLRNYNDRLDEHGEPAEPVTEKEAQACFDRFKVAVRNGTHGLELPELPETIDKTTVAHFVKRYDEEYLSARELTEKEKASVDSQLATIVRYFGNDTSLATWNEMRTFTDFRAWLKTDPIRVQKRLKPRPAPLTWVATDRTRTPKTIDEYRMRLRHMTGWGKAMGLLVTDVFGDDKFLKLFGKHKSDGGRKRGVTQAEEQALIAACAKLPKEGDAMEERIEVAVNVGLRLTEMLRTQMEDVNVKTWEWTVPGWKMMPKRDGFKKVRNTKNGNDRIIPIFDVLQPLFAAKARQYKGQPKAFIFSRPDGTIQKGFKTSWRNIKQHAKLDDASLHAKGVMPLHWHDLRGEAATRMLDRGVDVTLVSDIVGHSVAVLMKHYRGKLKERVKVARTIMNRR